MGYCSVLANLSFCTVVICCDCDNTTLQEQVGSQAKPSPLLALLRVARKIGHLNQPLQAVPWLLHGAVVYMRFLQTHTVMVNCAIPHCINTFINSVYLNFHSSTVSLVMK